jgi:acyl-CoA thioesterase FadM
MGVWIRIFRTFVAAPFRPRLALHGVSHLSFRVLPGDLDLNIHMNNARYLALMDIGRLDLILRTGLWRAMAKNHWQAVLAGSLVRYRRSLKPFQKFSLTSRLIGWDEKWFYIEHRIESGGVLSCQTVVRGAFLGVRGIVASAELMRATGAPDTNSDLPDWVMAWRDADRGMDQSAPPILAGA